MTQQEQTCWIVLFMIIALQLNSSHKTDCQN